MIYGVSAATYDAVYQDAVERMQVGAALDAHIRRRRPDASTILEAACGTGLILAQLADRYRVAGFDLSPDMLAVARRRLPDVRLEVGDFLTWQSDERFDVVICVGSSIGYALTVDRLRRATANLASLLVPGGLLLVEPWIAPDAWEDGRQVLDVVDHEDLRLARLLTSGREGTVSLLDIDFLIGRNGAVERLHERHEMGLFTDAEMRDAFRAAGLSVARDDTYPSGRGLYIGQSAGA